MSYQNQYPNSQAQPSGYTNAAGYQAQPQMSVNGGGGNKNASNIPTDRNGEREWSTGLCDGCSDCGTCCVALYCPCVIYQQNKSRMEALERTGLPHREGGESCGSDCAVYCILGMCGVGWALLIGQRSSVRSRYRITGDSCGDCMAAWCCAPCVLTQESMEIEGEEMSMVPTGSHIKA